MCKCEVAHHYKPDSISLRPHTLLELGKGMPVLHSQCGGAASFRRAAAAAAAGAAAQNFAAGNARHARRMRIGCLAIWRSRQAGSRSMQLGGAAVCAAVEHRDPITTQGKVLLSMGDSTTMLGRSGKRHTASGRAPRGRRAASIGTPAPVGQESCHRRSCQSIRRRLRLHATGVSSPKSAYSPGT